MSVDLALWDTAGQEDYDRLRPISYPDTDVLLVCFAVNDRDSLNNISAKWLPEVRHYCPKVPMVLVGTKIDLRQTEASPTVKCISKEEGVVLAKRVGAKLYLESSAKTGEGVVTVFKEAARVAYSFKLQPNKRSICCLF